MSEWGVWKNRLSWPRDLEGRVFILHAVHLVGMAMFDGFWTGDEPATQQKPQLPTEIPTHATTISLTAFSDLRQKRPELFSARDLQANSTSLTTGWNRWTPELWNAARELYERLNSTGPGSRHLHAKKTLVVSLLEGKIQSYTIAVDGGEMRGPLDRKLWHTRLWESRFEFGQMNFPPVQPRGDAQESSYIFLNAADLHDVCGSIFNDTPPARTDILEEPSQVPELSNVSPVERLPTLTEEALLRAYLARRDAWPKGSAPPSRDADVRFLQSISSEVTVSAARKIRNAYAHPEWTAGGRRKK